MLSKQIKENRNSAMILMMDELIPEDHILRHIDRNIDFDFTYELVKDVK